MATLPFACCYKQGDKCLFTFTEMSYMYIITLVRESSSGNWWMESGKLLAIICLSDHWTIASQCAIHNTLSNLHRISCIGSDVSNRAFYRYGGHIELIRFKEYYGMPRWHEHDPIYAVSFYFRFPGNFSSSFPRKGEKKDRCAVFGYNIDHLFFREMYSEVLFLPEKRA